MALDNLAFESDVSNGSNSARSSIQENDSQTTEDITVDFKKSSDQSEIYTIEDQKPPQWRKTPRKIHLTWKDVNISVAAKRNVFGKKVSEKKYLLEGVSGYAEPGSLLAIMGSSGAGKSTLLNILTWRNRKDLIVKGEILANGIPLGPDITNVSAYVQQDDIFMGALTVKEHLTFTARLRMDSSYPDSVRSARVQEVISQMGLRKCENTHIAIAGIGKTISGGEMKRLSFASELINQPSIMFCDEPTSGLDSYLSQIVVECMKTVCAQGCTVLCTIHQPSSETFQLFDRLLLLSLGKVVYHGETSGAFDHYAGIGFPCPVNYNPADHYISQVSVIPGNEEQSKEKIATFHEAYKTSTYAQDVEKYINSVTSDHEARNATMEHVEKQKKKPRYNVGFFGQFYACLVRAMKVTYRNPMLSYVKLAQTVIISVVVGLIYQRTPFGKPYTSEETMAVVGSIFLVVTNNSFTFVTGVLNLLYVCYRAYTATITSFLSTEANLASSLTHYQLHHEDNLALTFPQEFPIFRREHFNGMYSVAVYFFSKSVAELPTYLVLPFVYDIIVYFMFGLYPSAAKFFIFYGITVLLVNTSVSFGYFISAMSSNTAVALAIGPAIMMPLLIVGGFFIPVDQIPDWLIWLKYLSWFYYTNELLNINQWQFVDDLVCPAVPSNSTVNSDPVCLYKDGAAVLKMLNFHTENFGRDIGILFAILIGCRCIALSFLYYRVRESTR